MQYSFQKFLMMFICMSLNEICALQTISLTFCDLKEKNCQSRQLRRYAVIHQLTIITHSYLYESQRKHVEVVCDSFSLEVASLQVTLPASLHIKSC